MDEKLYPYQQFWLKSMGLLDATFEPSERDRQLRDLAEEYHRRCDAYDETTCTGPDKGDGKLPASYRELALINQHAHLVLRAVHAKAEQLGIERRALSREIARVGRNPPKIRGRTGTIEIL